MKRFPPFMASGLTVTSLVLGAWATAQTPRGGEKPVADGHDLTANVTNIPGNDDISGRIKVSTIDVNLISIGM